MKPSTKAMPLRVCARLTLAALATSTFSVTALAEQESLDAMTITANRMPTENALAPNTVITRADIDRLQINDLPTLLSRFPGVDMTNSGGHGKASGIFIRGTNSDQTLVLVDGVKWHSATSGGAAIQDFPVNQIERIEIVRGSRAGLYGSEAIGGVIQIFTRQGKKQQPTPYASLGIGSHNTQQASGGVSGGNDTTRYHANFTHQSTNGINARENRNPDHDGYRNNSFSAKVDHDVSERWSVGANILRAQSLNEYDGSSSVDFYTDNVHQVLGVNSKLQVNDYWLMSLNLSESRDENDNFVDGMPDPLGKTYNTRHRVVSVINTFNVSPGHIVNLGVDYDHDKIDSTNAYDETSRDNKAAFISWQANTGKHEWLLSARHDDNEAFGEHSTGTADYGYWLNGGLRITANVGTGFKAPSFNDLYYPGAGNPDVKPEKSTSYGIGIEGSPAWGTWALNAYQNNVRDLIDWAPIEPGSLFYQPFNVDKAKIKGIEFELNTTIAEWLLAFDASFLKPEDDNTGNQLRRRSKRFANLHLDRQFGDWSFGASWKLREHSFEDAANNTRLGGYGLVDFRVAYQIDSDWSVKLNAMNVFDKEYQTVNNFNTLDRTYMLTLHYQP